MEGRMVEGVNRATVQPAFEPDQRDYYIPVRKAAILDAMLADTDLVQPAEREQFVQLNRLLGCVFHFEYFARLEALRHVYHPVDPECLAADAMPGAEFARNYTRFVEAFAALLKGANFVEVSAEEMARAHSEHAALRVKVNTPLDDFHAVRFFRRGRCLESFELKTWFGLRTRQADMEVYNNVVLLAAIKPKGALDEDQLARLARSKVDPGSVLIKCFRNIASADLNVLLPNVRVTMSLLDKLMMTIPAVVGGVPILLKLVSSLTVLFVVIGFYLGLRGTVDDDEMKSAIVALGGLVALGAFLIRQWVRYERQSLKYLKEITDKVFFRSINHNAGFFDYILGAAEDQDHKEALLGYAFLRNSGGPQPPSDLGIEIENWLKAKFGSAARFEAVDAVEKLARLGLVTRHADGYVAIPLDQAVDRLNAAWHGFFPAGRVPESSRAGASAPLGA